jgi:hypothetical protein
MGLLLPSRRWGHTVNRYTPLFWRQLASSVYFALKKGGRFLLNTGKSTQHHIPNKEIANLIHIVVSFIHDV